MNELERILEELKSVPRKESNAEILDRMEQHIDGILDDVANRPESINQDKADADISKFIGMYQELLNSHFGRVRKDD